MDDYIDGDPDCMFRMLREGMLDHLLAAPFHGEDQKNLLIALAWADGRRERIAAAESRVGGKGRNEDWAIIVCNRIRYHKIQAAHRAKLVATWARRKLRVRIRERNLARHWNHVNSRRVSLAILHEAARVRPRSKEEEAEIIRLFGKFRLYKPSEFSIRSERHAMLTLCTQSEVSFDDACAISRRYPLAFRNPNIRLWKTLRFAQRETGSIDPYEYIMAVAEHDPDNIDSAASRLPSDERGWRLFKTLVERDFRRAATQYIRENDYILYESDDEDSRWERVRAAVAAGKRSEIRSILHNYGTLY